MSSWSQFSAKRTRAWSRCWDLSIDAADDVGESGLEPVVQDRVDPGGVVHASLVEPGNSSIEAIVLRLAAISAAA